jgi:hypothetical protein
MRANRALKAAHGLKPVQVWVLPDDVAALKDIERQSQTKAKYIAP